MFARNFPVKPTDLGVLFCGKILKYKFNLVYFTFNLINLCLFYFSLYNPGCLIPLPLPNSEAAWTGLLLLRIGSGSEEQFPRWPGHCTFKTCKPAPGWDYHLIPQAESGQDMGSGQLWTPLETQSLWTRATITSPTAQDLEKRRSGRVPKPPRHLPQIRALWRGQRTGWDSWGIFVSSKTPGPLPGSMPTVLSRTVHLSAI